MENMMRRELGTAIAPVMEKLDHITERLHDGDLAIQAHDFRLKALERKRGDDTTDVVRKEGNLIPVSAMLKILGIVSAIALAAIAVKESIK